ncbi:hypothetical protein MBLNU459_g5516t1 [Dothideomycetes sp. NU459]
MHSTDTNSPYCAVGTAISNTATDYYGSSPTAGQVFFACESIQYNLDFTVAAVTSEAEACAPPWVTNPASLSAWSAANPSYSHSFADPFKGIVSRGGAPKTATPSASSPGSDTNTLSLPAVVATAVSVSDSAARTSSDGSRGPVVQSHRTVFCALVVVFVSVF